MNRKWRRGVIVFFAPALVACATHQVSIPTSVVFSENSVEYARALNFSVNGLPIFSDTLIAKPHRVGAHYFQVLYESARPQAAFLVGVVGENNANWSRPFATLFHWTGKGFRIGTDFLEDMLSECDVDVWRRNFGDVFGQMLACSAIGTAGMVVTVAGGFVVGTVASAPVVIEEMQRSLDPTRERLLMVMRMTYDTSGRMTSYTFELPDGWAGQQFVTSRCVYDDDETQPRECAVTSTPERITRSTGYTL